MEGREQAFTPDILEAAHLISVYPLSLGLTLTV